MKMSQCYAAVFLYAMGGRSESRAHHVYTANRTPVWVVGHLALHVLVHESERTQSSPPAHRHMPWLCCASAPELDKMSYVLPCMLCRGPDAVPFIKSVLGAAKEEQVRYAGPAAMG